MALLRGRRHHRRYTLRRTWLAAVLLGSSVVAGGTVPAPAADIAANPLALGAASADPAVLLPARVPATRPEPRHTPPPATARAHRPLPKNLDVSATDIPAVPLAAYVHATNLETGADPYCGLHWQLLAGIGFIESGHAHSGGSSRPHWNGIASPPIYGPMLDGQGRWAAWPDTDAGRLDGNKTWDRAVGPMQFMPTTWARWGADGDGDGRKNPQDVYDAALAAAHYLCAVGVPLSTPDGMHAAVFSYNHSRAYVRAVLTVAAYYTGVDPSVFGVSPVAPHHRHHHRGPRHAHRRARHRTRAGGGRTSTTRSIAGSSGPTSTSTATKSATPTVSPTPTSATTSKPSPSPSPSATASPSPSDSPLPLATSTTPVPTTP